MSDIDLVTTVQRGRVMTLYGNDDVTGANDVDLNFPAGVWEVQSIAMHGGGADVASPSTPACRFRALGGNVLYHPRFSYMSGDYSSGGAESRLAVWFCEPFWIVQDSDWLEIKNDTWGTSAVNHHYWVQAIRLR